MLIQTFVCVRTGLRVILESEDLKPLIYLLIYE